MIDFEAIYAAVFAVAAATPGIVTSSRRQKPWTNCPASEQPALFLTQGKQNAIKNRMRARTRWELSCDLVLYTNAGDGPGLIPAQQMNQILNSIVATFLPDTSGLNRLGIPAQVYDARINGPIEIYENVLGPQEVALIPIQIITP